MLLGSSVVQPPDKFTVYQYCEVSFSENISTALSRQLSHLGKRYMKENQQTLSIFEFK